MSPLRKRVLSASAVVAVTAAGGAIYWFAPWKLVLDARVDEAPATDPPDARVLGEGAFRSLEHETRGRARLVELGDGSHVLRLDDLATSNGPELWVMLSATPATEDGWSAYDDGAFVLLERLKGNIGSQNYAVPADVDVTRYRSAVVWCKRFSVGFGAAPLE